VPEVAGGIDVVALLEPPAALPTVVRAPRPSWLTPLSQWSRAVSLQSDNGTLRSPIVRPTHKSPVRRSIVAPPASRVRDGQSPPYSGRAGRVARGGGVDLPCGGAARAESVLERDLLIEATKSWR
jgi:hypothetical protein